MSDVVNHPEHYISDNGIETIDVIKAFIKDIKDPFEAYCTGNIIKYICRWPNKNGVEDLKKARWYLDKLIDQQETCRCEAYSQPPSIPIEPDKVYSDVINDWYVKIKKHHIVISRKLFPKGVLKHFNMMVHTQIPSGDMVESVYHFGGEDGNFRDRVNRITNTDSNEEA